MASPEALVSALADPERLLLFARICTAPDGLPAADVRRSAKALKRLISAGLVTVAEDRYHVVPGVFREALAKPPADPIESLFSRGRLIAIPRAGEVRQALFMKLAERFDAESTYSEKDISEKLAQVYDDHVTLRRYMIDDGILRRDADGNEYWRAN